MQRKSAYIACDCRSVLRCHACAEVEEPDFVREGWSPPFEELTDEHAKEYDARGPRLQVSLRRNRSGTWGAASRYAITFARSEQVATYNTVTTV